MKKIATWVEDMVHAMLILAPAVQQLYQYNWPSDHKKDLEGGLAILSMNFWFVGKSGNQLWDSELSGDLVGDSDVPAIMYASIVGGRHIVQSLTKPVAKEGVFVQKHDCRVREGGTRSMLFAKAEDNSPSPFML